MLLSVLSKCLKEEQVECEFEKFFVSTFQLRSSVVGTWIEGLRA